MKKSDDFLESTFLVTLITKFSQMIFCLIIFVKYHFLIRQPEIVKNGLKLGFAEKTSFWPLLAIFDYFWLSNQKSCLTKNDGAQNHH